MIFFSQNVQMSGAGSVEMSGRHLKCQQRPLCIVMTRGVTYIHINVIYAITHVVFAA